MRRLLWLGPIGLLVAVLVGGCGGEGDPRTLREYVDRLDAIFSHASTRADEINGEFKDANAEAETDEEHMDAFRGLFEDMAESFDDLADELESLRPPAPLLLEEEHGELVASAANVASILEDFSRRADESESLDEMQQLFAELNDPRYDEAARRMGRACLFFQDLANANRIALHLECALAALGREQVD